MKRVTLLFALAAIAHLAQAVSPRPGLWWNPDESGRGYNVEIQDNTVVVTSFAYDLNGLSAWDISIGTLDFVPGVVNSSLAHVSTGQCFGCAYVPPGGVDPGPSVKIVFDSDVSGTIFFPGGSTKIQPEWFAYAPTTPDFVKGEWSLSFNIGFGIVAADWMVLTLNGTSSSGPYVGGNLDGSTSDVAVAAYDAASKSFGFLSSSGGYYDFYFLSGDDKRMSGKAWIYPVGGQLSGSGSPAFAARIFSGTELSRGFHLTSQTQAGATSNATQRARAYAAVHIDGVPTVDAVRLNNVLVNRMLEIQSAHTPDAN
jgi:hypothetical protein